MSEPTLLTPTPPDNTASGVIGGENPPALPTPLAETPPATTPTPPETPPETPPAGAPEKYADFTMPEGVTLDEDLLVEAEPLFHEANLTQETAQKLINLQGKAAQKWAENQVQEHHALAASWEAESKNDKEFGGRNLKQNMAVAIKGMKATATPALQQILDDTGLGNHPEVIRLFYHLGLEVKEPDLVEGRPGGEPAKGDARRMYPNSKMNP